MDIVARLRVAAGVTVTTARTRNGRSRGDLLLREMLDGQFWGGGQTLSELPHLNSSSSIMGHLRLLHHLLLPHAHGLGVGGGLAGSRDLLLHMRPAHVVPSRSRCLCLDNVGWDLRRGRR